MPMRMRAATGRYPRAEGSLDRTMISSISRFPDKYD